jgi:hypothetical protein
LDVSLIRRDIARSGHCRKIYAYVGGSPLSFVDPFGLDRWGGPTGGPSFMIAGQGTANLYSSDGQVLGTYTYTTGVNGVTDPSARNQGPLPPGSYNLDPLQISEGGFFRNLFGDWGTYRAPLTPNPGTNTYGRDGFFVHGGKKPGSRGCLDLGSGDVDFFSKIKQSPPITVFKDPE